VVVHLPDFEDGLLIAAGVLDVDREDVPAMLRTDRLHGALMMPTARVGGAAIYRTVGAVLRRLVVDCATGGILPRLELRFGWLMLQRAVELNGLRWVRRSGDREGFSEFQDMLRQGEDPGRPLERWLEERLVAGASVARRRPTQEILVSSPDRTTADQVLVDWTNAVDDGVKEYLRRRRLPSDSTATRRPQIFSVFPTTEAELYTHVERRAHNADALIVIASRPSFGTTLETDEARRALVPTLLLHPTRLSLDVRMKSRLDEAGIRRQAFPVRDHDPDVAKTAICDLVTAWLQEEYEAICDTARRHALFTSRFAPFREAVLAAQSRMPPLVQRMKLLGAGLTLERALALVKGDNLTRASIPEVMALSAAYEVPANFDAGAPEMPADRPAHLLPSEWKALRDVAAADAIPADEVLRMAMKAQENLALERPSHSVRRHSYEGDTKWRQIRADLRKEG
jgi:hypothetical protein